jgi:hypothetical protein
MISPSSGTVDAYAAIQTNRGGRGMPNYVTEDKIYCVYVDPTTAEA